MKTAIPASTRQAIGEVGSRHRNLDLLVLHGSRAREDAAPGSDWDFAFAASGPVEVDRLIADLISVIGSDGVDVADLERSSALLRYRAARDGVPVYERRPGAFVRFWLEAVRFWCEAAPVLEKGYEDILARLDR